MKGYKGFDKDLKCRDLQYEVGKETVVDGDIELCKRGIHFCENPHDIFNYYAPGENNRFAVVEAEDVSDERNDDDSKRVCRRLTVKAEISVFEICKIAVSTFFENFGFKKKIESADTNNAGYKGAAQAGDYGAARAGDPKQGTTVLPEQGTAVLPKQGTTVLPKQGTTVLPEQGTAVLPEQGTRVLPKQGTTVLPKQGTRVLPEQGTTVLPEQGTAVLPKQGTTVLPEQGTAVLPS